MEMRRGMPVWAPTDADMAEIRRRVSKERAKAARQLYRAVRELFRHKWRATAPGIVRLPKVPSYY